MTDTKNLGLKFELKLRLEIRIPTSGRSFGSGGPSALGEHKIGPHVPVL